MRQINPLLLPLLGALLCSPALLAKVPADKAAQLGTTLTPVGAVEAGNKEGTIPAWKGSILKLPAAFANYKRDSGAHYPNPFPEDKPRLKIDASNIKQYAAQLPAGAVKRLELNPKLYYNVYPTRRTAAYPDAIYAATKANALSATLSGDDDIEGATLGFPFPIPSNGAEAMVNHRVRYRGDSVVQSGNTIVVGRDGQFQVNGYELSAQFVYSNVKKAADAGNELIFQIVRKDISPPRLAGNITLVWDKLDGGREAWQFSPGTARVRQAPSVAFDNPVNGTDALQNVDQTDLFNGSQSRYTWKLIGKKEMVIPYNNYSLLRPELKLKDIIQPGQLNPEHLRYELHRVWVVEANIKPGTSHTFTKRVMYFDEDSWNMVAADNYDSRGNLYQFQEGHLVWGSNVQATTTAPEIIYHFTSGRYFITAAFNEDKAPDLTASFSNDYFTSAAVQKMSTK
ncbi:MAG: DUF1329 domain-containing protein [Stagnimonas sp.]|nr:DUF1329 domain-containing protein [Stagnimonas sp.]